MFARPKSVLSSERWRDPLHAVKVVKGFSWFNQDQDGGAEGLGGLFLGQTEGHRPFRRILCVVRG